MHSWDLQDDQVRELYFFLLLECLISNCSCVFVVSGQLALRLSCQIQQRVLHWRPTPSDIPHRLPLTTFILDMISVPQVKPFRPSPRSHSQLLTRDLSSQIPALNRLWNTLLAPRLLVLCVKIVWWKQLGVVWCKGPYVIYRWEQPPLWWPYTFITPFLFASGLCHS